MIEFKWIDVKDALPEKSGEYFCIRYGMIWGTDIIMFNTPEFPEDNNCGWSDALGHMNGGGGGVKLRKDMTDKEKHFQDNYGKVIKWFPSPSRPEDMEG